MNLERGDIIWAADPFTDDDDGRPWLIINNEDMPYHDEQFICLSLTSSYTREHDCPYLYSFDTGFDQVDAIQRLNTNTNPYAP